VRLHKHIINLELKVQHLYATFKYERFQVFMAVIMKKATVQNGSLGCDATSADRNLQPFWRYMLYEYSRFKSYHAHKSQ